MAQFRRIWLLGWCALVMLVGAVMLVVALPGAEAGFMALFALLGQPPAQVTPPLRELSAVLGAVCIGWGATLAVLLRALQQLPATAARRRHWQLTGALLLWYVIDSACSLTFGFPGNALGNTLLLLLYVPLARPMARADAGGGARP